MIAVLAALTAIVAVAAWAVPVWPGDQAILAAVQGWQSPLLTAALGTLTYLGWYPVAALASAVAVVILLWRRWVMDALLFAVAVSSALLTLPLKELIGRPRPDYTIIESAPQSMGFPSGHAAFAILLGGMVIYLVWRGVEKAGGCGGSCAPAWPC